MFGVAIVPSVLMALGMAISPESPRWLFQVWSLATCQRICSTTYLLDVICTALAISLGESAILQQGRMHQAEIAIKSLYGNEKVFEVIQDLHASGQGSREHDAGWLELFSKRYWKGIFNFSCNSLLSIKKALENFHKETNLSNICYL